MNLYTLHAARKIKYHDAVLHFIRCRNLNVNRYTLTERTSTYKMTKWSVKERAMEAMSHMLDQGGMVMSD